MHHSSLSTFLWNEQLDAPVAVPSPKLSGAECVLLSSKLHDDKRKEVVQEFTALYPHWKPIEVEAAVSKYMLIA